ncbi:MAG: hypothetical protein V3V01_17635 [Acidimicrobiales bacterium]
MAGYEIVDNRRSWLILGAGIAMFLMLWSTQFLPALQQAQPALTILVVDR